MFRLLKYMKRRDLIFLLFVVLTVIGQVFLELKMPEYTKNLTSIATNQGNDLGAVWFNGGMMLLCAVGAMFCAFFTSYFASFIASHFSASLRKALFEKILSFSSKEIHRFHTASLITRTTNDVVQVQNFVAMGLGMLIRAPIMAIWAIVKISSSDISWTLATAISIGVIAVFVVIGIVAALPKFTVIQKLTDDLNSVARDGVTGVRVIRAFNAEDYQKKEYEAVNDKITRTHLFVSRLLSLFNPLLNIVLNGLVLAIYWIAAILINRIAIDPANMVASYAERVTVVGNMAAFSQYAIQVVMSFLMLVLIFIIMPRTIVSAKRINEVLRVEPSIVDGDKNEQKMPNLQGESVPAIVFDNVDFSYSSDEHYAIKGASLTIEKGETVAFVGATGCGKTTLMNLLLRFYDVTGGAIYVNGIDVRNYALGDLRNEISLSPQKASLLKGTIKSNVAAGQKEVDEERLALALRVANCEFVDSLENGADAAVAQKGSNFSGGQKQRIAVARTIYKDSNILVFDDSFSALDFKTDAAVRKAIAKECAGKTVLIVAQRIGTIRNADKIVVMEDGQIVGVGTHKELMKNNAVYQEIALSQLDEEEL